MSSTAVNATPPDAKIIKVMVVDDSVVIRGLVSRWLGEEDGIEVVAKHINGLRAVNDIASSDPDVVVLDIEMPEMDGMTALEKMIKLKPSLVVIMASTLTRRNAEISLKALQLGAADYIPKPEGNRGVTTSQDFRREIVNKVRALGLPALRKQNRVTPPRRPATRATPTGIPAAAPVAGAVGNEAGNVVLRPFSSTAPRILVIGSSTGGPQALSKVLEVIAPKIDNIPIVITQHMPPTFTALLAEHIGRATGRTAKEAEDGEKILKGNIYVAPGARHLIAIEKDGSVLAKLTDAPPVNFCKPAVDPMFESVAEIYRGAVLGVVLTGMGHDGRDGARAITNAGGSIIAQDEETSVVWGMPGAVAEAGLCSAVLPIDKIGAKIIQVLGR
jgi:two-component system, chemotaxis family, protein-glutamate methylesterase/glutaminase